MLSEIILENFKCFLKQRLSLGQLTLLTGLNGMGKSSVIQAILLLRQSLAGHRMRDRLVLNGELIRMGTARDILCEAAEKNFIGIELGWKNGDKCVVNAQYNAKSDALRLESLEWTGDKVLANPPFVRGFQYLQAERLGPRTANRVSDYQVKEEEQLGTAGEYTEQFIQEFENREVLPGLRHYSLPNISNLKSQINAWLGQISPGAELHIYNYADMDLVNIKYAFVSGSEKTNEFRSTSVGFGLTYVLPILTVLLAARPGALVILENPEAHIHPGGQFAIGGLLAQAAAAGVQVLVETHSDHILNGVRVAVKNGILPCKELVVHYFTRIVSAEGIHSKVYSPSVDHNGRINEWPDGFFDTWDKGLECLLNSPD